MKFSKPKFWLFLAGAFSALTILSYTLALNQSFQEKAGWHLSQWAGRVRVWLNPPDAVSFSAADADDGGAPGVPHISTLTAALDEPVQADEKTYTYKPIPLEYAIEGGAYFSQHNRWNYCGPANIAMALSYYGWEGDHDAAAKGLRTYSKDKNVMPYEMAAYARTEAGLGAIVRVGGSLETLKRLIAAGFPVVVEKGPNFRDIHYNITWMGHYQTLTGYNEQGGYFIAQDSYIEPDYHQPYDLFIDEWRSFNYTYLVVYPPEKENDVLNLLGPSLQPLSV